MKTYTHTHTDTHTPAQRFRLRAAPGSVPGPSTSSGHSRHLHLLDPDTTRNTYPCLLLTPLATIALACPYLFLHLPLLAFTFFYTCPRLPVPYSPQPLCALACPYLLLPQPLRACRRTQSSWARICLRSTIVASVPVRVTPAVLVTSKPTVSMCM
jgi:hypothetical protein